MRVKTYSRNRFHCFVKIKDNANIGTLNKVNNEKLIDCLLKKGGDRDVLKY